MKNKSTCTKTISCLKIDEEILRTYGGEIKTYNDKEVILQQDDTPQCYYQIVKGRVKENHYDEDGKEFIHNILDDGQSFGDSMLFIDKKYPINAVALTKSDIIRLSKHNFLELLKANGDISVQINTCLSQKLYHKIIMTQHMASQNPATRLKGLLEYLKSFHDDDIPFSFQIQLTRQQIADLTGLRVETVIRTIKKMAEDNSLKIENKKVFF